MAGISPIEGLVDEMLLEIFSYLGVKDLAGAVQHVCSRWREICSASKLWKTLTYRPDISDSDGDIINFLKDAPKLTSVDFEDVIAGPKIIITLAHNCGNITKLKLGDVISFNCELMKDVQRNCPYLEYLEVKDRIFRDTRMGAVIAQFLNLRSLIIIQDPHVLTFVNLKTIADGCPQLEHFEMSNRIRSSEEINYFLETKKDKLKYLAIICWTEDQHCTLPLLSKLQGLNTLHINRVCKSQILKELSLSENSIPLTTFRWTRLGSTNVDIIMRPIYNNNFRQLEELTLSFYINFDDRLMDVIISYCPLLKKLYLPQCWNLSNESLKNLYCLKYLQSVDFSASKVNDYGMKFLELCEQLEYVDLSCSYISGRVLLAMTRMEKLKVLILNGCHVNGIRLETIPTRLKALRRLSIRYCNGVRKEDVALLRRKMPQLQVAH